MRSTDCSATSGLAMRDAVVGEAAPAQLARARGTGSGMASDSPRPMSSAAQRAALVLARRQRRRCVAACGTRAAERGVAVVAGDLLDHVDLDGGVVAPRRDRDVEVVAGRRRA